MADWYKNLYVGETIKRKKRKVIRLVDRGCFVPDLYLITAASNGKDQLDILDVRYFLLSAGTGRLPEIIGLAMGHREAVELVCRIAAEACGAGYGGNLLAYLRRG